MISFLFAAVSAWAVAMISITPVSGMTLTTLIVSAVILARLGLAGRGGDAGHAADRRRGVHGAVDDRLDGHPVKIGYWVGGTPRRIQWSLIGGAALASLTVTAVMLLFAHTYGFILSAAHPKPLPAPQANAMAAVARSMMSAGEAPWFLYGLGAVIAVVVEMLGVSGLAFALGMYLPMDLNTPAARRARSWRGSCSARPRGERTLREGPQRPRHAGGLGPDRRRRAGRGVQGRDGRASGEARHPLRAAARQHRLGRQLARARDLRAAGIGHLARCAPLRTGEAAGDLTT